MHRRFHRRVSMAQLCWGVSNEKTRDRGLRAGSFPMKRYKAYRTVFFARPFWRFRGIQNGVLCFAFDPVPRSVGQHMTLAETVKIFFF